MSTTRLTSDRYLELFHQDGERLLAVAEDGSSLPVPACAGWAVDDLVVHLGTVYSNKVAVLRLGRRAEPGEWDVPGDEADAGAHLAWCHAMLHTLAGLLAAHAPDESAWSWGPEQTVGFWQRRMAHETAIHRIDAEAAAGQVTPVADDLALDGIDELFSVFVRSDAFDAAPVLESDDETARVRVRVLGEEVVVSGSAPDVLLWLWGRPSGRGERDGVVIEGTPNAVAELVRILRERT